jgi:hypothetical protein
LDIKNNFSRFYYSKDFLNFFELRSDKDVSKIFEVFIAYGFGKDYFLRCVHNSNIYDELDEFEELNERQVKRVNYSDDKTFSKILFDYFYFIDKYLFKFSLSP